LQEPQTTEAKLSLLSVGKTLECPCRLHDA